MRAALSALALSACVTVGEADLLVPPVFEPDTEVTWQADGETREGTFADYLTERGGRLGAVGGRLFDAEGAAPAITEAITEVSSRPARDGGRIEETATLTMTLSYETDGPPGFAVARALVGSPGARVAVACVRAAAIEGSALLVHCGGSGADIAGTGVLSLLKSVGDAESLLFDYPGYGASEGARTVADLDRAVTTLAAYLDAEPGLVVLWGHSFGGLVCAELAARMARPAGVIVETSAPDAGSAVSYFAPWWAAPFVRVSPELAGYDAAAALVRAGAPVLVLGAARDRMLSVRASRALADRLAEAGADVTYAEAKEAGHFDAFAHEEGAAAVRAFLERLGVIGDEEVSETVRLRSAAGRQ